MDPNTITNMIAVFDDAVLNARLDYRIDLATDKVCYIITCHWKPQTRNCPNGVFGKTEFRRYSDAAIIWGGLPNVAKAYAKEVAA